MLKNILFLLLLSCSSFLSIAQNIYFKTFGNPKNKAVLFLHGGPGYNCASFEATTAQQLADQGFFVIVYDRRGEGRSVDPQVAFTFQQSFDDIQAIYKAHGLSKATLIGHSFGGMLATLFAEAYPDKVQSIVLVGAPVSLQSSFKNILTKSRMIYESKKDSMNLKFLSMLEKIDTSSIMYSTYCFAHAMQNGFYSTKNPSPETKSIYARFKTDSILIKHAAKMTADGPQGFWKNEHYTTLDLSPTLSKLVKQKIKIFGLYGQEDGLYSAEQIADLQKIIGENQLKYLENCSHSVFVDQQTTFIEQLKTWLN
jgi:proline iminopeptidase